MFEGFLDTPLMNQKNGIFGQQPGCAREGRHDCYARRHHDGLSHKVRFTPVPLSAKIDLERDPAPSFRIPALRRQFEESSMGLRLVPAAFTLVKATSGGV
jgi:hypothetical protein